MKYPIKKCYICNSNKMKPDTDDGAYCTNCNNYAVAYDRSSVFFDYKGFKINIWFPNCKDVVGTRITSPFNETIETTTAIEVNKKNYFKVFQRLKKMQIFR